MSRLFSRSAQAQMVSPLVFKLLLALLILVSITMCSIGSLLILRRIRQRRRAQLLPQHSKSFETLPPQQCQVASSPPQTALMTQLRCLFGNLSSEKAALAHSVETPRCAHAPLPEIHIHLSEEHDEHTGSKAPGKIFIVKFGDELSEKDPAEDHLPPYRPLRPTSHA